MLDLNKIINNKLNSVATSLDWSKKPNLNKAKKITEKLENHKRIG